MAPTLETARLILRPPIQADLDGWETFCGDAETMRFLGGTVSRSVAWRHMSGNAGSWSLLGFGMFAVIEKASGRWIGRLGPIHPEGWPAPEVGWGLVREAWGKGYAFEGAVAAMDFAVDTLGWTDIIHSIDPDNAASQGLARRLGSTNRGPGVLPDPYADHPIEIWGQTADEWRARRAVR